MVVSALLQQPLAAALAPLQPVSGPQREWLSGSQAEEGSSVKQAKCNLMLNRQCRLHSLWLQRELTRLLHSVPPPITLLLRLF